MIAPWGMADAEDAVEDAFWGEGMFGTTAIRTTLWFAIAMRGEGASVVVNRAPPSPPTSSLSSSCSSCRIDDVPSTTALRMVNIYCNQSK